MRGVSVIVPTYNRAELLKLTLRSILAQTVTPLEVIVVDDGSTDHTVNVCAEFSEAIKYIFQENRGLSAARNTGINAARGDWVGFCDSDDLWRPQKLEVQLAVLKETGARWSLTDFGLIDPDGNPRAGGECGFSRMGYGFQRRRRLKLLSWLFYLVRIVERTPDQHFSRWLRPRDIQLGSRRVLVYEGDAFGMLFEGNVALPSTSIVARALIDQAGPFDQAFRAEETEFFHRLAAYAPVAIVMEPLSDYRVGHASLIAADAAPFVQDALRSIAQAALLRPALTPKEQAAFKEGRRRLRLRLAYARLSSLDRVGARQAIYDGWVEDRTISVRTVAIMLGSLLPQSALRGLQWAKRIIRSHSSEE
jgi:glycosyltransferase involved in cell wall biosynthesis